MKRIYLATLTPRFRRFTTAVVVARSHRRDAPKRHGPFVPRTAICRKTYEVCVQRFWLELRRMDYKRNQTQKNCTIVSEDEKKKKNGAFQK